MTSELCPLPPSARCTRWKVRCPPEMQIPLCVPLLLPEKTDAIGRKKKMSSLQDSLSLLSARSTPALSVSAFTMSVWVGLCSSPTSFPASLKAVECKHERLLSHAVQGDTQQWPRHTCTACVIRSLPHPALVLDVHNSTKQLFFHCICAGPDAEHAGSLSHMACAQPASVRFVHLFFFFLLLPHFFSPPRTRFHSQTKEVFLSSFSSKDWVTLGADPKMWGLKSSIENRWRWGGGEGRRHAEIGQFWD